MGTLYLDRNELTVSVRDKTLVLHQGDRYAGCVPLALTERVVMRGSTRLDTGVLRALAGAGAGLLVLGARQPEGSFAMVGARSGDARRRVVQVHWFLQSTVRQDLARRVVLAKVRGQQALLSDTAERRPDLRKPLHDARDSLEQVRERLEADAVALSLPTLLGLEGAAAAAYFRGFTRLFAPALGFSGRNRRPPRDPVNAVLSLTYTLAHFEAVLACQAAALDPCVGFLHELDFGRASLAADLIEPLRHHLDAWVWACFREEQLRPAQFTTDKGACLLGKAGRRVFYERWELERPKFRRWLRRQVSGLCRELDAAQLPAPQP